MEKFLNISFLGLLFGTIGTTLGGIIGVVIRKPSEKLIAFILSLAGGLMTSIVMLDLYPEAIRIANGTNVIIGTLLGTIFMVICNIIIDNKFNNNWLDKKKIKQNNNIQLLKVGIITSIGLAIHNLPEGLAIGAGFDNSNILGYSLAIAICIHDIPEGISMAIPMKNGGMKIKEVMFYVILSGIATGIGAVIGAIIGKISEVVIASCLSFAGGTMLYIVVHELIPEAYRISGKKITLIGLCIGMLIGIIVVQL